MSIPGSGRTDARAAKTAPGAGAPGASFTPDVAAPAVPPPRVRRTRIMRWQGIIPLIVFGALVAILWLIFGDRVVRETTVEVSTKALGTQVDIASLHVSLTDATLRLGGLQIADPFDSTRNLIQADTIHVDLDPRALLERKVVIERLTVGGASAGAARRVPARSVRGGGFAPSAMRTWQQWKSQFDVPLLSLTPIDTIRSIALDPTQLASVKQALVVKASADSVRSAIENGYRGLRLQETYDSSRALIDRLSNANPRTLGLDGTRRAIADLRRGIANLNAAKDRVEALERSAGGGLSFLASQARTLDDARRRDYAFARGLLKLPSFDSPDIGAALFGPVSIDRFQQAMYYASLAENHLPPGLRPKATDGPERVRRSGTTVRFPKLRDYPTFLLRRGDVSLALGSGASAATYSARVQNLTTEPSLVGAPAVATLRRAVGGAGALQLRADALMDHAGRSPRDTAAITAANLTLPAFALPGLPLRLDPRVGRMEFRMSRAGDRIAARWRVQSDSVRWQADSTRRLNRMESVVTKLLTGINGLELTADLEGTLRDPSLTVRSNLDRAIADRLRAMVGEEVQRAEARVRAEVDRVVEEKTAPVRAQVDSVRADANRRIADAKERIERERAALDGRLKSLSGGFLR